MGWTMILKNDFGVIAWTRHTAKLVSLFLLLSLFTIPIPSTDTVLPRDQHFSWKAGQWGQCIGEKCGSGGIQTRTLWCVHVDGWSSHHSHCRHSPKPESQRQCYKVCDWHQDLFEWDVSDWGPCLLIPFLSNELRLRTADCITAQHGIQRRSIHCVRTSNRTAVSSRICEFFSHKPPVEQACLIPCPQDCVVSDFTPWSSCSKTCGVGLQHRTRHVLAPPMYGGADFPNLTETRTCTNSVDCSIGEGEYQYSLKVGAWSECRLPQHKDAVLNGRTILDYSANSNENNTVTLHTVAFHHHSHHHNYTHIKNPVSWELEVGYQTRHVRCTRSDGKNSMLSLCTKDSSPLTFQACVMPEDCQTSDWSPWSPCSKTCRSTDLSPGFRVRSRIMTQIPHGGGKACPPLQEKEACNIIGDLLPTCPRYVWRSTDWNECHILPLLGQQDQRQVNVSSLCGAGIQTRKTYCVQVPEDSAPHHRKEVSRPVDGRLCDGNEPPLAVQSCSVPCQHHCVLSQWSSWGPCIHENCKEPQGKKGTRRRTREVLWQSGDALGSCPHVVEFTPCEDPVCYLWQVQREDRCVPTRGSCGPGAAVQNVSCVDVEGEHVPDTHCEGGAPPAEDACEVPCPADCVVGSWSLWSPCSHSCANKTAEGRQSRTRTVLAIPRKDGKSCPAAPALEEWRVCSDHPCMVFHWEASAWSPCVQNSSARLNLSALGNDACAVGVQSRRVTCVKKSGGPVSSKRCSDSSRPESSRPCLLPCKKDCIVTPFSEWTSCPSTCLPENGTAVTQSRYRTIIQRPANGGQECPDTLYEERDCDFLPGCPLFRWRMHKWHSCILVPDSVRRGLSGAGEDCGDGLETRGVSCVGENGEAANLTACLRWAGSLPPQIRTCRVACKDDCTLTAWSKFSECAGCGSTRSRTRSLTGRSKKRERCLNEELFPLEEVEACPCDQFLSQPYGDWSACILPDRPLHRPPHGWMSRREVKECGQGLRFRAVACVNQQGHLVKPTLCTQAGYIMEVCHIPCPLDCKLSDWSAWSACSASHGSGLKIRSKWLREKAFNGGRPCPKLDLKNQVYEAVPCRGGSSQNEWRSEAWSICTINTVDDLPACGEGVQSRKIRCVKKGLMSGEESIVDDSQCDAEEMPPRAQVCHLACPDDCVVGPWGPWSSCPLHCDAESVRNRSRKILRESALESGTCPEQIQSESCVLNGTCFTYWFRASEWSTCQLSEGAVCGPGFRLRLLDCVRSDGKIVAMQMCEQFGVTSTWPLLEDCVVECSVSCLLSDWSPWSECSHICGSQGQLVRNRRILQESHQEGRLCPSQLNQTKSCPVKPCYDWLLSDWSACIVEGAECGEGVRRRNLSCIVHWGNLNEPPPQPVETELCGDAMRQQLLQQMEQPCFVPCPGDCHLTEWSPWSSCQLICLEGRSFEYTGRQARSRAVIIQAMENQASCPHQVFETKSCKEGKCHTYQWKTGGWSNNERAVWCQRSDGVNVTGGCFQQKRPTTLRHCHPPCTKPFSHCTPSGVCGCERGYTEVMTSHGFLDYCTRTPGFDNNKKADVKTTSGRLKPRPSQANDLFSEWTLRPVGPDGRVKLWVYAVAIVGFIIILFVVVLSFLICKPSKTSATSSPPQKPLTLAYDGDMDM
ncbi:thrombospondin type-1 domain-containing protein 7B isoform X2 [Oryzias latipes]|uniref:Thrombospondin type-1 domain-containing protein 7A n=1 Tax=Oryzias latipes TaxID=8090 RepID=H2N1S7_ORYLA|nr:thrombospondin type-1 domain-containing protein 7B isoform X2 [Oryzias latipes]